MQEVSAGHRSLLDGVGMGYQIIIVAGDAEVGEELRRPLEAAGHHTLVAVPGAPALAGAAADAVVCDLASLAAPERFREILPDPLRTVPLVAVVAPEGLAGLDPAGGVSDFVVRPVRPGELVARVEFALRRSGRAAAEEIRVGALVINTARYEVKVAGRLVGLTLKEYELLKYLAAHRGRVFTREALLSSIWGYEYMGGTRTVDVHVRRLRMKLEPEAEELIETVRGVGYRFAAS